MFEAMVTRSVLATPALDAVGRRPRILAAPYLAITNTQSPATVMGPVWVTRPVVGPPGVSGAARSGLLVWSGSEPQRYRIRR